MSNSMYLKSVAVVVILCGVSVAAEPNSLPAEQKTGAVSDPNALSLFSKALGRYTRSFLNFTSAKEFSNCEIIEYGLN